MIHSQQTCMACGTAVHTEYKHLCGLSWTTAGLECSTNASDTKHMWHLAAMEHSSLPWRVCWSHPARVRHESLSFARAIAASGSLRKVFVAEQRSSAWVGIQVLWTCVCRGVLKVARTTTCPTERYGSTQQVLQIYDNDSAVWSSEHVSPFRSGQRCPVSWQRNYVR